MAGQNHPPPRTNIPNPTHREDFTLSHRGAKCVSASAIMPFSAGIHAYAKIMTHVVSISMETKGNRGAGYRQGKLITQNSSIARSAQRRVHLHVRQPPATPFCRDRPGETFRQHQITDGPLLRQRRFPTGKIHLQR